MDIIFFTHPGFQGHQSMPRYAKWLAEGMQKRGHDVTLLTAEPHFTNLPVPGSLKKWMGYLDQFFLFPAAVRKKLKTLSPDTLFVFTDHALGPWVPLTASRKHIVHCHDFLAQKSAAGRISQNPTGWSGKKYQAYIRAGYSKAQNFISISNRTQQDLHDFLGRTPKISEVVYNGVNPLFTPIDKQEAATTLSKKLNIELTNGFLLHVGGNQWYKNRKGVVQLYDRWRQKNTNASLPLLMIGEQADADLIQLAIQSAFSKDIHFLKGLSDQDIKMAYTAASVFLFPSLAEGFGWPIAEAMACDSPVITTGDTPMTEVGGEAASYLPVMPPSDKINGWLKEGAMLIDKLLNRSAIEKSAAIEKGRENVKRFNSEEALDKIEAIYKNILHK